MAGARAPTLTSSAGKCGEQEPRLTLHSQHALQQSLQNKQPHRG